MKDSQLYKEIQEQPAVIGRLLATQAGAMAALAGAIQARGLNHLVIAARGTSDNAGRYAQYVLGALNGLTVTLATPSLFSIYQRPPDLRGALVLGISQSGQSPDIVAVLAEARRQGCLTAALTNEPASPLAATVDHLIELCAGAEKAVAATKTYTAELAAIALLSSLLSEDMAQREELARLPEQVAATLALAEGVPALAERYVYMRHSVVIGRGFNYATAFELALKLKELTYTIVEPYSSADFRHGPMAILEPGFPVILIGPSGALTARLREFAGLLTERGAELIVISDDEALLGSGQTRLGVPAGIPEWLSPAAAIIPGQLFALALAHSRGYNVDAPRGITKVTETY